MFNGVLKLLFLLLCIVDDEVMDVLFGKVFKKDDFVIFLVFVIEDLVY